MLVGSVKNASLFQKFTLNLIGFGVCDLGEPIRCHSSLPFVSFFEDWRLTKNTMLLFCVIFRVDTLPPE